MEEPLFSDNYIATAEPDESTDFFENSPQFLIYLLRCTYFKAVVQSVLLFGTETWVVNPRMGKVLEGFQDQVVWLLTGRLPRRSLYRRWEYTLEEAEREEAGFELTETYIWRRQNTDAQYIAKWPIMDLCEAAERKQGGGWGCGGGNRRYLTLWWQGRRQRRRRRRKRMGWRNKWGGGLKRNNPGAGTTATYTK